MTNLISLTNSEYERIRDLVYSRFGINLTEQKKSLIVGRLQKVLRQYNFNSFSDYLDHILNDATGEAVVTLVNRITTNHTFFYRENDHFDFFVQNVIPELVKNAASDKKIRIWCAGCSSGEEPYTIAMMISEYFKSGLGNWDIGILATDISNKVLDIAKTGIYTIENRSRLPEHLQRRYFKKQSENEASVVTEIRKLILFRRFNLMRNDFPFRGKFHVIFCRNVMIYFDNPTKKALVQRFYEFTRPLGYLFVGHSETLGRLEYGYQYIRPAVYRKGV